MENIDEQIEMTAEQPNVADKETTNNDNAIYKQTEDFAAQFARWAENPLVSIAIADPRLCRFIGDLLAGEEASNAARRNFPQPPSEMPADVASRFNIDEATARQVEQQGHTVMGGWSDAAIQILLRAVNHDNDVSAAEEQGYIRGRNSAIETLRRRTTPILNL